MLFAAHFVDQRETFAHGFAVLADPRRKHERGHVFRVEFELVEAVRIANQIFDVHVGFEKRLELCANFLPDEPANIVGASKAFMQFWGLNGREPFFTFSNNFFRFLLLHDKIGKNCL